MADQKSAKTTSKKKLYLHIGRHKTGTSSLQNFFTQKSDLLASRGILYPKTGRKTPHGTAATAHHEFSHTLHYKPAEEVETLFRDLAKEAEGFDTILLSSEDFQNQKDFKRLAVLFADYDLTVIAYMREGLGYGLSGFAQRIHFSGEIFNIRQYMERQNIRITAFIRNWSRLAERSVFRLYERDKLKNRDIVEDFLDIIGLDDVEDTNVVIESNPSLSGNLLGLKMLLNLMGQSMLIPYVAFEAAARLAPTFNGKIFVSDRLAQELRGLDDYNAVLKTMFPDMTEPSFETGSKVFDLSRWDADMDLIASIPEFSFAKTLRLGALGQVLENHGVAADLGETDFLTQDLIESIQLPGGAQIQQVRERAVAAANDAVLARKARSVAELAAAKALTDARAAFASRDEMAEKLKVRTKKLEKDMADASLKIEEIRRERDDAIATYKLSAETALKDRDAARAELKSQGEKLKSDAEATLKIFNEKIEKLTTDRDALAAKLKEQAEKSSEDINVLTEKAETALKDRDAARAKLKSQGEKLKSDAEATLKIFNEKIETLSGERETLATQLKSQAKKSSEDIKILTDKAAKALKDREELAKRLKALTAASSKDIETFKQRAKKAISDRDAARASLSARDAQSKILMGQIYYFRAENFRLKGKPETAQEMYQKAIECDPDNQDYIQKLEALKVS